VDSPAVKEDKDSATTLQRAKVIIVALRTRLGDAEKQLALLRGKKYSSNEFQESAHSTYNLEVNLDYLKNIVFNFIVRDEERLTLLPVLATILRFSDHEKYCINQGWAKAYWPLQVIFYCSI
jgi:hypothetical protein